MAEADETYIPRSVVTSSGSRPDILGDYRLMEKLGQGGMGAVYRAEHTRLGKQVAVKLLPEESMADPAAVARFQREMKAVGQLQHPNIIQALDAREEGGFHFLVMELVEGIELDDLRKTIGPIRLSDAADIIVQAANGLQHAHEQGLVHRDIKPSNLLLSAEGIVKVLDLGLALLVNGERAMSDNLTVTGQVMGTLDYMAPEQADDTHGVDIRADIYSLGCTFFALLAGKPPFDGAKYTTPVRKITAHMTRQAPSILNRRRDVPPEAARILNRMLAKKPADRFQSPAEVVEALQPLTAKSNLRKLAKKTALKIAQANEKENPDLTGQDTNPQASAGPATANRIEEPSTEADAAGASPPDITDGKVPGDAVPTDRADNGTQAAPADLDAAVQSIIVEPPTYADQRAGHKASQRSSSDRGKVPRSLWIALGLAGFVVLLSVIIIKIKDKNGDVVATIEVPEGGSVEIGEDSPAKASGGRESPDGTANPLDSSTKRPDRSPELNHRADAHRSPDVEEPPPLEEWLKGRKIITVRQDGTADFTTIQAALDALKPGQVVEVLDKGPYVETLSGDNLPDDIGLISRLQSTIQVGKWHGRDENGDKIQVGHQLGGERLRIEGLCFTAAAEDDSVLIESTNDGSTWNNCLFLNACSSKQAHRSLKVGSSIHESRWPICICNCVFAGKLQTSLHHGNRNIAISRNLFLSNEKTYAVHVPILFPDSALPAHRLRIEENVFATSQYGSLLVHGNNIHLTYVRNTVLLANKAIKLVTDTLAVLKMRGNLIGGQNGVDLTAVDREALAALPSSWDVGSNRFAHPPSHDNLPLQDGDVVTNFRFRSTDLSSHDFARPEQNRSTGGNSRKFAGALPPGPAPPDGDWFTRLQDRWREAAEVSDDVAKTLDQAAARDLVLEALTLKAQPVRVGVGGGRGVDVLSPEQIPHYEYHIFGVRFFQTSTLTDDQVISWLKRVPQIQSLQFDHCANITDGVLSFVGENDFPVTDLTLVNTKCTVEGLLRFLRNRAVRYLNVSGELFDPAVAAAISTNEGLTGVIVNNGDPKDWEQLCTLPNAAQLSTIGLSGATLSAEEWQQLQTFENAETFYFTSSNIADRDLSTLQQLEKLQRLSLGNTKVTDVGLKTLSEIKTLRYLEIHHTKVTLEGLKELQRAIPQCQIIWDEGTLAPVSQE